MTAALKNEDFETGSVSGRLTLLSRDRDRL